MSAGEAVVQCTTEHREEVVTSRRPTSPALLYVPTTSTQQVRFRVLTPDCHPIAVTVEPALAAATALAVARHHPARYAVIAASDGRWLEVDLDGRIDSHTSRQRSRRLADDGAASTRATRPTPTHRSRSHAMTDTIEHVLDIPLDQLAPHPRNVRRSLGDLRELTRSIRERGVETPLVVMPADGAGMHHIVAGHRRRAAAEAAGRTSAPCIVREFADEADVVLSMLAENTQRSDGLNIVDEAQALAAVIDLRGGVSARKLAAAVGHSEGWVRTRLSLLTLPGLRARRPPRREDHPRRRHRADRRPGRARAHRGTARRPNLSVWQIEAAARQHTTDKAVDDASAALDAAGRRGGQRGRVARGTAIVEDAGRPRNSTRPLTEASRATPSSSSRGTTPRWSRSRSAPSHDATEAASPTASSSCHSTNRRRRTVSSSSTAEDGSEATEARAAWLSERLRRPSRSRSGRGAAGRRDVDRQRALRRCRAGIPQPRRRAADGEQRPDHARLLHAHLAADPKRVTAVAVALVAATCEERARHSLTSSTVARYLDAIERLGYQPTDWEHTQRLTAA